MKKLLIGLLAVVVLLVIVVVAIPFFVPVETLARQVTTTVEEQTGRTMRIGGPIELSVFPTVSLRLGDVTLANAPGGRAENMVALGELDVEVALLPLVSGNVTVDRLVLREAVVALEVDADGRGNWEFDAPAQADASAQADTPAADETAPAQGDDFLSQVRLGEVELVDAAVSYTDLATGEHRTVSDLDLVVRMADLDSPLSADGSAEVQGRPMTFEVGVERPRLLLSGEQTTVTVAVESDLATLSYDGAVARTPQPRAAGTVDVEASSLTAIAEWLQVALPPGLPLDRFNLSGTIDASPTRASFRDFNFGVDDMTGHGTVQANLDGPRPVIDAEVELHRIDLDVLMRHDTAAAAPSEGESRGERAAGGDVAPGSPGEAAIDLSPLAAADVDLRIAWDGIVAQGVEAGGSRLTLSVQDGALDLELEPTPLFGGTVVLAATAADAADVPQVTLDLDYEGVQIGALAERFTGLQDVTGQATGQLGVYGRGATVPALMRSLSGGGEVHLAGGGLTVPAADGGEPVTLSDATLRVALPSFDGALAASGDFLLRDQRVAFTSDVANPRAALAGDTTALATRIESPHGTVSFDGTVDAAASRAAGALQVALDDISALMAMAGQSAADVPVNSLTLSGQVDASPSETSVTGLSLQADDMTAAGDLSVSGLDAAKPGIVGRLDVGPLDLDRFTGGDAAPAPDGAGAPDGSADGDAAPAGRETIDLSALNAADADLVINSAGLRVDGVDIGPTTLTILLQGGVLDFAMTPAALYGGTLGVDLQADGAAAVPAITLALDMAEVQAEPLLTRFGGIDWLVGTTTASLTGSAAGADVDAMLADLDGGGSILLTDGAIKGVNLAAMLRRVGTLGLDSQAGVAQQTDFAALGGNFVISDGVAMTDDLTMLAPLFRVTGQGTVSLPARSLDMRLTPRLVADLEGQGGQDAEGGLAVPVVVSGTFDNISFAPDLGGAVRGVFTDPQALMGQVEALQGGLGDLPAALSGSGGAEGAIEGILQGLGQGAIPAPGGDAAEGQSPTSPAQQLLQGILGGAPTAPAEPQPGVAAPDQPVAPSVEPPAEPTPPPTVEDAARQAIEGLLGGQQGDGSAEDGAQQQQQTDPAQQLLEGLFGNQGQ